MADAAMEGVAPLPQGFMLDLAASRAVMQAAELAARAAGCRMCIAVLDGGGHLQLFTRMDETHSASIEVAMAKARCAVAFRRPTKRFAEALAGGGSALLALPGVIPFEGGVPLVYRGAVVGAIGVSGGTPEQDGMVGEAGAAVLTDKGEVA